MDDNYFKDDMGEKQHTLLLMNAAASYGRKYQRIKAPSRNVASVDVSEFHFSNKKTEGKGLVDDLTTSLDKTGKLADVSQKVKRVKKEKFLPAPLEKPEAEKIKRTVAFDATKALLNQWEPIVGANRVADQLNFPLNVPYFRASSSKNFLGNTRGKTPLEKEVEHILSGSSCEKKEDKQKKTFFLNRKEILLQRRELAHIRAQQSFKEAKAWQQNKIKSKKYHRILRRERTKKQIQEFEELQKTDPEAALKKLEELEKTRMKERMTLRHRSTGQWAQSKAVHAKYDKQSRKELAQQLRLGKELTQKIHACDGSDGENEEEENRITPNEENNPWMHKDSNEYQEFSVSYRKFWDQQEAKKNKQNKTANSTDVDSSTDTNNSSSNVRTLPENDEKCSTKIVRNRSKHSEIKFGFLVNNTDEWDSERNVRSGRKSSVSGDWECIELKESEKKLGKLGAESMPVMDLDDAFEGMEVKMKHRVQKKLSSMKSSINQTAESDKKKPLKQKANKTKESVESLRGKKQHSVDSRGMIETPEDFQKSTNAKESISSSISALSSSSKTLPESKKKSSGLTIDPQVFVSIDENKPLKTAIPSVSEAGDDDEEAATQNNSLTIAEAFVEDDIANKFRHEKETVVKESKVKSVDLTLPGWGDWTGKGITSRRKKRCFVINAPKSLPRKDDRKESVIINENADDKARVHQVSEIPFPYSGVDSFEASIRAPLGTTWIPETAHNKLTSRKVSTLMGAVIEPLTEDALVDERELEDFGEDEDLVPEEL